MKRYNTENTNLHQYGVKFCVVCLIG